MAATRTEAPADTRMMGIVHDALRRDLRRARVVLAAEAPPPRAQREAVAEQVSWLMSFLHAHHHGEDVGLYPAVRERNAAAGPLIDAMDAQHRGVGPAIEEVEAAAVAFRGGDAGGERMRLLAAVDALEAVLLPHLRQEEDEMMPVVAATLTDAELSAIDHEHFVKPKSFVELGYEGHWLLDDLDVERRDVVTRSVPAVPRFVLLHGFARRYRRRAAACWDASTRPARRVQTSGRVEVEVDAPPDAVWDVVRDVTRVGEWSHECRTAVWLDGASEARPGTRFRGRNVAGVFRWGRVCEVVSADPWELTWRTVPSRFYPDRTTWTIRLREAEGGGTRIEQTFDGLGPELLLRLYGLVIPAHRDRTEKLAGDLRRLGAVAEPHEVPGALAESERRR